MESPLEHKPKRRQDTTATPEDQRKGFSPVIQSPSYHKTKQLRAVEAFIPVSVSPTHCDQESRLIAPPLLPDPEATPNKEIHLRTVETTPILNFAF